MAEVENDILIEYVRMGNILRVTAIDSATGTEVVFQAPASLHPKEVRRTAVNKLKYVLGKSQQK